MRDIFIQPQIDKLKDKIPEVEDDNLRDILGTIYAIIHQMNNPPQMNCGCEVKE